jgi:hypothetical protein
MESMLLLAAFVALNLPPVSPTAPNRQPQLAAAGGTVALVFGSGETIWLARSLDNGRSFGAPSKVTVLPKMLLGRHRGPRVAISGNAIVVSAIASEPGDLLVWRSTDGGRTWGVPAAINDTPKAAREGLHSMVGDAEGHMAAAWLDDRGGNGKRLYGAFSQDAGRSWSRNVLLYESPDGTICQCCDPSLAVMGHGEFAVMWRNALGGSRDLYTLRLRDGRAVGAAVKQGEGTWKLDACPMDGGGIAVRDGQIGSAWRREHDIYLAVQGKPEVKIGSGQDVALGANTLGFYAVWSTAAGIALHTPGTSDATHLSSAGAFPAMVALSDGGMLVAWEENGAIATARL